MADVNTYTSEPTNPQWPVNVLLFRPSDSVEEISSRIKATEDVKKRYELLNRTPDDPFANEPSGVYKETYSSKEKHFSTKHYALLFAPGQYRGFRFEIGYYVQMAGLGKSPNDVRFIGEKSGPFVEALNKDLKVTPGGTIASNNSGLCLDTFWRSAENFRATNCQWAVSQAAPLRNVIIDDTLKFGDGAAYSSGGFLANAKIGNKVDFVTNQQWFSRSVEFGENGIGAVGGCWNTCFSGCTGNVPQPGVLEWQGRPSNHVRTVESVPDVRIEKPFITMKEVDGDDYYELVVPPVTKGQRAIGPMHHGNFEDIRSFSKVKVCKPFLPLDENDDYTEHDDESYNIIRSVDVSINEDLQKALDQGKDLVLCPGIFFLSKSLIVRYNNQVILGLGLATLVAPQDGTPCIRVEPEVSGVRIAGLILEASLQVEKVKGNFFTCMSKKCSVAAIEEQRCLLEVGNQTTYDPGNVDKPVLIADIFCRVGGSNLIRQKVETDVMIRIHSGNVVGDNLWLWRADHVRLGVDEKPNDPNFPFYHQVRSLEEGFDEDGLMVLININECFVKNALEVNGDDVKMYGLFCEHTLEHQLVWRGERGNVTFFQCELPYDVGIEFTKKGFTGYYVQPNVHEHVGRALGVYSNFQCYDVKAPVGFKVPASDAGVNNIQIESPFTVFLSSKGGIKNVIKVGNEVFGGEVKEGDQVKRAWIGYNFDSFQNLV